MSLLAWLPGAWAEPVWKAGAWQTSEAVWTPADGGGYSPTWERRKKPEPYVLRGELAASILAGARGAASMRLRGSIALAAEAEMAASGRERLRMKRLRHRVGVGTAGSAIATLRGSLAAGAVASAGGAIDQRDVEAEELLIILELEDL